MGNRRENLLGLIVAETIDSGFVTKSSDARTFSSSSVGSRCLCVKPPFVEPSNVNVSEKLFQRQLQFCLKQRNMALEHAEHLVQEQSVRLAWPSLHVLKLPKAVNDSQNNCVKSPFGTKKRRLEWCTHRTVGASSITAIKSPL